MAKEKYGKEIAQIISEMPVEHQQISTQDARDVSYYVYREVLKHIDNHRGRMIT